MALDRSLSALVDLKKSATSNTQGAYTYSISHRAVQCQKTFKTKVLIGCVLGF